MAWSAAILASKYRRLFESKSKAVNLRRPTLALDAGNDGSLNARWVWLRLADSNIHFPSIPAGSLILNSFSLKGCFTTA